MQAVSYTHLVSFDTQSSEETEITPSTPGQMVFARYLKEELESWGLEEITLEMCIRDRFIIGTGITYVFVPPIYR